MLSSAESFRWLCLIVILVLGLVGLRYTSSFYKDWGLPIASARYLGNTTTNRTSPVTISGLYSKKDHQGSHLPELNKNNRYHGNTTGNRYRPVNITGLYPSKDSPFRQFVSFNKDVPEYIRKGQKRDENVTKTILFWSTYYSQKIWWNMKNKLGKQAFQDPHCYHKNCFLTADRNKLKEADLLMFYHADPPRFPSELYPNKEYGHFIHESPCGRGGNRSFLDKYQAYLKTHRILTLTYRFDSDVYLPYTAILTKSGIKENMKYNLKYPLSKRSKSVVWPVSHCKASSMRDDYARELNKYIPVDIYGACGKMRCSRSNTSSCLDDWEKNYKFYLAFENNICLDYITEKLYTPLGRELIPVVMGGGNYTRDAPPHSVIDVRDFASPRDLADYLHYLSENEEEYNKYFQWKPYYEYGSGWTLCRICDALHEESYRKDTVTGNNYNRWFYGHEGAYICDNDLVKRMRRDGGW